MLIPVSVCAQKDRRTFSSLVTYGATGVKRALTFYFIVKQQTFRNSSSYQQRISNTTSCSQIRPRVEHDKQCNFIFCTLLISRHLKNIPGFYYDRLNKQHTTTGYVLQKLSVLVKRTVTLCLNRMSSLWHSSSRTCVISRGKVSLLVAFNYAIHVSNIRSLQ